jgi:hypothetical protein
MVRHDSHERRQLVVEADGRDGGGGIQILDGNALKNANKVAGVRRKRITSFEVKTSSKTVD